MNLSEEWREHPDKGCADVGFDIFFDESPQGIVRARRICVDCPVFHDCQNFGIREWDSIPYGIFAGWTGEQRRVMSGSMYRYRDWRKGEWERVEFRSRPFRCAG